VLLKNSLGMSFSTMPGTPVLFAQWETRVADFEAFLKESGYRWEHKPSFPQTPDHPVVNVTLSDALAFCNWLTEKERAAGVIKPGQTYRLPTNSEWAAAVGLAAGRVADVATSQRLTDRQSFPWGLSWPPPSGAGNYNSKEISGSDDGYLYTAPVGSFAASPEGLYDLGGNVWEWTWTAEVRSDTQGILRGGSWMYFAKETLLSEYEYRVPGTLRAPSVGFRCVLEDQGRTAIYLAETEKAAKDASQARRAQLTAGPTVTQEDVKRRMEQLASRTSVAPAGVQLPDPKTLKAVVPDQLYTNSLGMVLLPLQKGKLLMGVTEVRIQDYQAALAEQGKTWANKPTFLVKETHPVMNVTWQEALEFCAWLTVNDRAARLIPDTANYRLPTDQEWSAAAGLEGATPAERHLGNKTHYPWGATPVPPVASVNLDSGKMQGYQDSFSYTAPVGSYGANAAGFKDLAGNVLEWCQDPWPGAADERTLRGSSWLSSAQDSLLTSFRSHLPESAARPHVGFRVVLDLGQP
jgi:formylglycine-generating enzyme required for sulfatase activity